MLAHTVWIVIALAAAIAAAAAANRMLEEPLARGGKRLSAHAG